jgi:hypothetical protein
MKAILYIFIMLSITSFIFPDSIEIEYFGDIDKPLPVVILSRSNTEYRADTIFRPLDETNRSIPFQTVILTIPSIQYDFMKKNIIAVTENRLIHANMLIACCISNFTDKVYYEINVEDIINIFDEARNIIHDHTVLFEMVNYVRNLQVLLKRYGG